MSLVPAIFAVNFNGSSTVKILLEFILEVAKLDRINVPSLKLVTLVSTSTAEFGPTGFILLPVVCNHLIQANRSSYPSTLQAQ